MHQGSGEAGEHLQEEPQYERGEFGSRDTGSDEPAGGPVDRPAGKSAPEDSSSISPPETIDEDMPDLQAGDGGG